MLRRTSGRVKDPNDGVLCQWHDINSIAGDPIPHLLIRIVLVLREGKLSGVAELERDNAIIAKDPGCWAIYLVLETDDRARSQLKGLVLVESIDRRLNDVGGFEEMFIVGQKTSSILRDSYDRNPAHGVACLTVLSHGVSGLFTDASHPRRDRSHYGAIVDEQRRCHDQGRLLLCEKKMVDQEAEKS